MMLGSPSVRRTRQWTGLAVAVGAVLAVLATLLSPTTAPAGATETVHIPELGAQWHATWGSETDASRAKELETMQANGVEWVRIDVGWAMLQPKPGAFDTNWAVPFVEKQIDAARAHGLKVLVTFWLTPSWANGGAGTRVPPTDPQTYADALAYVVERWKGKVQAWEVWNEPNSADFFNPADPVRYVNLLQPAYRAAKAADPSAIIVFGGPMYVDTDWIRRAYDAGAKGYFDVMAVHPYMGKADAAPETADTGDRWNMTHVDALVELMKARGNGAMPIWFTEFGWSVHTNTSTTPVWARGVTEAEQVDYLRRSVALVRLKWPQVTTMIWYNSRDKATGDAHQDGYGLMRRDFSSRPSLLAFESLQQSPTQPLDPPPETSIETLIASESTWRYSDTGKSPGNGWRALLFDDSGWKTGRARLGYGDADITGITAAGRLGYAFRKSFQVEDPRKTRSLQLRVLRDDGIGVWINGTRVWDDNVPTGPLSMKTAALSTIDGSQETQWIEATIPAQALVAGRNDVAVSVHNRSVSSSDIKFDLVLERD